MEGNNDVTYFAKTNFRSQEAVFGIKTDDRRRHMYIIGKTGMGKTTLLEHLVIQDIRNGHGVAYIDPHGDTAEKIISMIPADRVDDVIYFNPADLNFPIAFNVIEKVSEEHKHLVASGLVGVFKKLWADSWGPRLEYILRNAILALLEYPGSTLLGVMRILVDPKYRERVVDKVTDPVVKSFWQDEFSKWNERVLQEVVAPIQNKVGQFLSSSLIRNIVGQTHSSFSVREAMDQKKIIIMNLSKGHIGEDNSALIGAMMITKIQLAAMARVDTPEEERHDFYLYVDEFQNFSTESFANILSEARKYRLNLILANQYITQLLEVVRDAIFGNVGTMITFRVGAMDAEFLEKEFEPIFLMNDIVNLPKYSIYLKLMINGVAGDAFSAQTLPPLAPLPEGESTKKVVELTRNRYASSKAEVEEKIRRWSGMLSKEEVLRIQEAATKTSQRQTNAPLHTQQDAAKRSPNFQKDAHQSHQPHQPHQPHQQSKLSQPDNKDYRKNTSQISSPTPTAKAISSLPKDSQLSQNGKLSKEQQAPGKELYPATCNVCDIAIEIPFKPDGSRPTFCKECLKEYQRAVAKTRAQSQPNEQTSDKKEFVQQRQTTNLTNKHHKKNPIQPSQESPLKLSQIQRMAPKKFD